MADDLTRRVFEIFSRSQADADPQQLATKQASDEAEIYTALIGQTLLPLPPEHPLDYNSFVAELQRRVELKAQGFAGQLPALAEKKARAFIAWSAMGARSEEERNKIKNLLLAAFVLEGQRNAMSLSMPLPIVDTLSAALEKYSTYAAQFETTERHPAPISMGDISAQLGLLTGEVSNARKAIEQLTVDRAALEVELIKAAARLADMNASIEAVGSQISEEVEKSVAKADERIDHYVTSVNAKSQFESLKLYWFKRADEAQLALGVAWFVLLILLVVLPAIAIYENEAILKLLSHIADAAKLAIPSNDSGVTVQAISTISRLILVTIPIALYVWLIRLVVRFQMRSMLLLDDARNRATILDTWYKMIEDGAASKEDRALILSALCRPAPGHGGDNVDPPNFTELVGNIGKANG